MVAHMVALEECMQAQAEASFSFGIACLSVCLASWLFVRLFQSSSSVDASAVPELIVWHCTVTVVMLIPAVVVPCRNPIASLLIVAW